MSQNCKVRNKFNCRVVETRPIQIVRHWLSDGSLLMTTLYYSVGCRTMPQHSRINQEILDWYLSNYNFREESRKGETTWHIHSKKESNG